MVKLSSRETRVKLSLDDPREYGGKAPEGPLATMLYAWATNNYGVNRHKSFVFIDHLERQFAICQSLAAREDGPFYQALSAARDYNTYATILAELTAVSCQRTIGGRCRVTFAIPLTLHCAKWPVQAARADEDWLDFEALNGTLRSLWKGVDSTNVKVLPHLFLLEDLNKLPWSTWYALTEQLPLTATELESIQAGDTFDRPTENNRAQARVVLGSFSCSTRMIDQLQLGSFFSRANTHVLTKLLQGQLGESAGLKVIAGPPSLATAAVSEARHMLNCAKLRCMLDVAETSLDDMISFEAEPVKRLDGEGSIRFKTRTLECEWVLQKAEPWAGQKNHWRLFFKNFQSPYVTVQLGLSEHSFDPYAFFEDEEDDEYFP